MEYVLYQKTCGFLRDRNDYENDTVHMMWPECLGFRYGYLNIKIFYEHPKRIFILVIMKMLGFKSMHLSIAAGKHLIQIIMYLRILVLSLFLPLTHHANSFFDIYKDAESKSRQNSPRSIILHNKMNRIIMIYLSIYIYIYMYAVHDLVHLSGRSREGEDSKPRDGALASSHRSEM